MLSAAASGEGPRAIIEDPRTAAAVASIKVTFAGCKAEGNSYLF